MSERTLKRMVAVLGVLVLAWILTTLIRSAGTPDPGEGGGEMAAFLDALAPDQITAVVFSGGEDTGPVRLERGTGPGLWTVGGHPADSAQVARFLSALEEAGTGAPVSVNPENHARMEVDDATARVLVLEGGAAGPDTLLVGKSGPSMGTVYARLPGHDEVHVVDADLSSHAGRSVDNWRSRRIAAVDTAAVTALEVRRGEAGYRLERGDSVWTVDGGPADEQAVRNLLGELGNLQAQGFPEEERTEAAEGADTAGGAEEETAGGEATAGEADRTVTAHGAGGEELLVVHMWEPGEDGGSNLEAVATGAAASQADTRFTMPSWRADRLAPEADAVRGDDEGEAPPAQG